MEYAIFSASRSRQDQPAGSDRRAGLAFRTFPDLVLATHRAPRRAGRGKPRAKGDCGFAETPWSYRRDRPRLVGRPADSGIQGRPAPARRGQSQGHAGLRGRTVVSKMTWSIIARDELTGQFGIAVATCFFAVGARVPHVAAGVGAIATEALVHPYYGIDGLKRLREVRQPHEVLETLIAADA